MEGGQLSARAGEWASVRSYKCRIHIGKRPSVRFSATTWFLDRGDTGRLSSSDLKIIPIIENGIMAKSDNNQPRSAAEHYWTVLPKYIAAVDSASTLTRRIGGCPTESSREYWASVLFIRLCSGAISVLHLCPGSPANTAGTHWDFSSVAPLVRSLVQTGLLLFYLGTDAVDEDESRARVLVMQLRDCKERAHMFQNFGGGDEKVRRYEVKVDDIRTELASNSYFVRLPEEMRNTFSADRAYYLTEDQTSESPGLGYHLKPAGIR